MGNFNDKIKWEEANFLWNESPHKWSEVIKIVKKVAQGGGSYLENYKKLDKEEKKKFIEVIVKIKGNQEYSSPHIYNEKKEVQDNIKVTTEDIKMVIKEVLGINLEIKNINV
tara:strand:- start:588 stop:923 length:336 start_codon:yes stop_codon:yes gene_type:complete